MGCCVLCTVVLLQVELTQTMEAFRQHLVQTTLMAQQLLAQQVVGQATREAAGPGSSRCNSRPLSAAAVRRLSQQQANSSGGSRPGSSGQPRRLPAAGSTAAGAQGPSGVPGSAVSPAGYPQQEGLVQLAGVLEAEEPPTTEEVQAYARYLGMDPSHVSCCSPCRRALWHLGTAFLLCVCQSFQSII